MDQSNIILPDDSLSFLAKEFPDLEIATTDDENKLIYIGCKKMPPTIKVIHVDQVNKNIEYWKGIPSFEVDSCNQFQTHVHSWQQQALLYYNQVLYLAYQSTTKTGNKLAAPKIAQLNAPLEIIKPDCDENHGDIDFKSKHEWTHGIINEWLQSHIAERYNPIDSTNLSVLSLHVHENHMIFLLEKDFNTYFLVVNMKTKTQATINLDMNDNVRIHGPTFGPCILNSKIIVFGIVNSEKIIMVHLDELIALQVEEKSQLSTECNYKEIQLQIDTQPYHKQLNLVSSGNVLMVYTSLKEYLTYFKAKNIVNIVEGYDAELGVSSVLKLEQLSDKYNYRINRLNLGLSDMERIVVIFYISSCFIIVRSDYNQNNYTFQMLNDIESIAVGNDRILWKNKKKYEIGKKIGSGAVSVVYNAVLNEKKFVNLKFRKQAGLDPYQVVVLKQQNQINDPNDVGHNGMVQDREILKKIRDNEYVCDLSCRLIDYFVESGLYHLVLTKLGPTLQHLFDLNGNKFSIIQVCGMMSQMIGILYKLHAIGYVNNDIKPENIVIGNNTNDRNKLYLIDFGVAKQFWDFNENKHVQEKFDVPFEGTFRFASFNHHCHAMNQSRRDDLESLIYVGIYFLNQYSLPWRCENVENYKMKSESYLLNETKKLKLNATVNDICESISIDSRQPFIIALNHVRKLKFDEMPSYLYLQSLFQTLLEKQPLVTDLYQIQQDLEQKQQALVKGTGKKNLFSKATHAGKWS